MILIVYFLYGWKNKPAGVKLLAFTGANLRAKQIFITSKNVSLDKEYGEDLAEHIDLTIEKIENEYNARVYAIVTDNDSKIVKGGRLAENGTLWQTTCQSHSGNLLIKNFVPKEFQENIRSIIHEFSQLSKQSLILRQGGTKLKNWPDTRFCYVRDSLESVFVNIEILKSICDLEDAEVNHTIVELLHDEVFHGQLRDYLVHLIPICKLINECQDPQFNIADGTEFWLTLELPTNRHTTDVQDRIDKAIKDVAYAANLLHHNYQGQNLNETQRRTAEYFLFNHMSDQCKVDYNIYQTDDGGFYANLREKIDKHSAMAYWTLCGAKLKDLGLFAKKLFTIPASTAMLEGLFSHWTYIHNNYRNRLSEEKSQDLLDIYYAIRHINFEGYGERQTQKSKRKHADVI